MLSGRSAFVSGGTGYVGEAICRRLADHGARVFFSWHRNEDRARALEADLLGCRGFRLDIRDHAAIAAVAEAVHREVEALDLLVNNAAVSQVMPFSLLEAEDLDLLLDVNVKGTVFLTKALVRPMLRRRRGVIVNIGSLAGHRMLDVPVHYALSKAAVAGFSLALASELRRYGIRVNTVSPGLLEGGVSAGVPPEMTEDYLKHCAAGRAGTAREVADTVCFLASDGAGYINGQNLLMDGGL